jgi:hypothetical protein
MKHGSDAGLVLGAPEPALPVGAYPDTLLPSDVGAIIID